MDTWLMPVMTCLNKAEHEAAQEQAAKSSRPAKYAQYGG